MNQFTLHIGQEHYVVPLNLSLVITLEEQFGSLLSVLQSVKAAEFKTEGMISFLKLTLSHSECAVEQDVFDHALIISGISGLTEQVVKLLSVLVAGISVLHNVVGQSDQTKPAQQDIEEDMSLGKPLPQLQDECVL